MTLTIMKTSVAGMVAVLALGSSQAHAQDAVAWGGAYGSAYVSGAMFNVEASDFTDTITNDAPPISALVPAGGFKLGYNFAPRQGDLVLGLEVDVNAGLQSSQLIASNPSGSDGFQFENKMTLVSFLGRAGIANGDLLAYATGGPVLGTGSYIMRDLNGGTSDCTTIICTQTTENLFGLAVGGGVEWEFREDVIARFELMHYALPTVAAPILNNDATPACGSATPAECSAYFASSSTQAKIVISYRF